MKRRQFVSTVAAGASAAVLAGCSSGGGGDGGDDGDDGGPEEDQTTTTTAGPDDTVVATSSTFDPLRLSVDPGTEVTWQNGDAYAHSVVSAQFHETAAEWSKDSRMIANTGQETHTFAEAGVYEYFCSVHGESTMCGAILVGDVSLDATLPCEEG